MSGRYDDILNHPYPLPSRRAKMSMTDRAAQFSPFAALTGYSSAIEETGRLTDREIELDENEKAMLDLQQQYLQANLSGQPEVSFTCFVPDARKEGGSYETVSGKLKKIDIYNRVYVLTDGRFVQMDRIVQIKSEYTP